jgi:hypothetical protein
MGTWRIKMAKCLGFIIAFLACMAAGSGQVIENIDSVRTIHNTRWFVGKTYCLELVRRIGDIDTEDANVAFNYPSDVAWTKMETSTS